MILYLHGFRSSPRSTKAQLLAQAMKDRGLSDEWACPQLPASPAAAMWLALECARQALERGLERSRLTVIGSSLGGFYAAWLAERLGCRAVLLNPVVHATRDLATQVGSHRTFHDDEPFEFLPGYVDELAQAESSIQTLTRPERYFLMAATGDEVLNWREMQARFAACRQRIIEGSDHGISDFADWMPEVLAFALGAQVVAAGGEDGPAGGGPRASGLSVGAAPEAPIASSVSIALGAAAAPGVEIGSWVALGPEASAIRTQVFVQEQHVSPEEELDALDAQCVHALARDARGRPIATGRLLPDGHIGRMAVAAAWRGKGVGSQVLQALVDEARRRGDAQVVLAAQLHARPFYARHGFAEEGETFMDAGIPHRLMRRSL
ncbi:N-acetyltransferase domain-containing protein OS=Castellaniella defragrans OX=75697 GN=HNR28_003188 PE=4 SV=1 [Castellaniella defragrans]